VGLGPVAGAAAVAGVNYRAEEESGNWGAGGEEDAVVFDSVGYLC
jgi:hypothetical protein